jgi:DNA-binding MarR family transcriptional regulator
MGKEAQMSRKPQVGGVLLPVSGGKLAKGLSAPEWRKDLLISWLFRASIKLQTSLDRRFLRFGMTLQEASVLLRCVQAGKVTPGRLAAILGRDKGKITRFIDRLEASRFITRDIVRHDRRLSLIKPTGKGKQVAPDLTCVFDSIRKELFVGILESDVRRLGQMLRQLHKNANRIGSRRKPDAALRRARIGIQRKRAEGAQTNRLPVAGQLLTASTNGEVAHTISREEREELVLK